MCAVVDDLDRTRRVACDAVNTVNTVTAVADVLHRRGLLRRHTERAGLALPALRTRAGHTAALVREALGETPDPGSTLPHCVDGITRAEGGAARRPRRRAARCGAGSGQVRAVRRGRPPPC